MRVLVVEPYFSGSHAAWAEGFRDASGHEIELLTLQGRFWKWRMFGGALTLAQRAEAIGRVDAVLASDMLDVASFSGHVGGRLGNPPIVLYMHENQLTYPLSPTARDDLAYAYMNWSSMVRADAVWFNSRFHLESVFEALPAFLRHFPDNRHVSLVNAVEDKSSVMPVGVDLSWIEPKPKTSPPLIVWNQRWEYDKDPVRLFDALYRLDESGRQFKLAVLGENFRNVPTEFEEAKHRLAHRVVGFGFAERNTYRTTLLEGSVTISTAKHEFFGIGAVEAMAAGAAPVYPNGLSYPELVPTEAHEMCLYTTDEEMDAALHRILDDPAGCEPTRSLVAAAMQRFDWIHIAKRYDSALQDIV